MKTTRNIAIVTAVALVALALGSASALGQATHEDRTLATVPDVSAVVGDDDRLAELFGELQMWAGGCRFWYEHGNTHTNCTCNCFWDGCSSNCKAGEVADCFCKWGVANCGCQKIEDTNLM